MRRHRGTVSIPLSIGTSESGVSTKEKPAIGQMDFRKTNTPEGSFAGLVLREEEGLKTPEEQERLETSLRFEEMARQCGIQLEDPRRAKRGSDHEEPGEDVLSAVDLHSLNLQSTDYCNNQTVKWSAMVTDEELELDFMCDDMTEEKLNLCNEEKETIGDEDVADNDQTETDAGDPAAAAAVPKDVKAEAPADSESPESCGAETNTGTTASGSQGSAEEVRTSSRGGVEHIPEVLIFLEKEL